MQNSKHLKGEKFMKKKLSFLLFCLAPVLLIPTNVFAAGGETAANSIQQVQQYNFSINILAMLLVGFGFLMVFVKKYGYSATTGTYLVVGVGLPLYLFLRSTGILSAEAIPADSVRALLFAEFAVAAALISMVLWIFWPSFCAAIVPQAQIEQTVINTIMALCGATLATFVMSSLFRKGRRSDCCPCCPRYSQSAAYRHCLYYCPCLCRRCTRRIPRQPDRFQRKGL